MAIVREFYEEREDGVKLYKTYSDENFKILQHPTEIEYDEAIDIENTYFDYTETDTPIDEEPATIEDYQRELERLGVQID